MAEPHGMIDRRTLLKLLGATGASATAASGGALLGGRTAAAAPSAHAAGATAAQDEIDTFEVRVSDADLEDLQRRLENIRWPPDSPGAPWSYGTDRAYLQELIEHWRDRYDWRAHESQLNSFNHYTTTIDGQLIHFIQERGRGPAPLPLVMSHGWPGTIWEMLPSVGRLANPSRYGGEAADAFSVVVPSIPGFGFSGEPLEGTNVARTAELWVKLMDRLGYERFGAYGSDWGAGITRVLGARYPGPARRRPHAGIAAAGAEGPADRRGTRLPGARRPLVRGGDRLPAHPGHEAADARLRSDRLAGGGRRVDHREAPLLERLRR